MRASQSDFRIIANLIGLEHWTDDDWKSELPVERAKHWLPLVIKLHVPQQALLRTLEGTMFYDKTEDGSGWKEFVKRLLDMRARVLLALDHAERHDQPVKWEV